MLPVGGRPAAGRVDGRRQLGAQVAMRVGGQVADTARRASMVTSR